MLVVGAAGGSRIRFLQTLPQQVVGEGTRLFLLPPAALLGAAETVGVDRAEGQHGDDHPLEHRPAGEGNPADPDRPAPPEAVDGGGERLPRRLLERAGEGLVLPEAREYPAGAGVAVALQQVADDGAGDGR